MNKIEIVVALFIAGYEKDRVQMFHTPCIYPDRYQTLYDGDEGEVRYCADWDYMEILECDSKVFKKVFNKYGY